MRHEIRKVVCGNKNTIPILLFIRFSDETHKHENMQYGAFDLAPVGAPLASLAREQVSGHCANIDTVALGGFAL
jgi:hypothetical protein